MLRFLGKNTFMQWSHTINVTIMINVLGKKMFKQWNYIIPNVKVRVFKKKKLCNEASQYWMLRSRFLEKNYLCNEITQYIIFRISFCWKKTFVEFNYTINARIRIKDLRKKAFVQWNHTIPVLWSRFLGGNNEITQY